ncbi:MAG: hypothetical protein JWP59_3169 [Massilia sp.]|nr:hypothetical protein [Massilia sp.]
MTFSTFLRPAALLAVALTLASCGGKATFPVTGTVSGLLYDGLVLSTNGMDVAVPAKATSFSFPNTVSYGEVYNVVQKTPPQHQSCVTVDPTTGRETGTDTAGRLQSVSIIVTCATNAYTIGGTISVVNKDGTAGTLADSELQLTNGSTGGTVVAAAGATTFTFSNPVAYNVSYGVTVLAAPSNAVCTVANGTGVMGDAAITNISVTCQRNS